MPLQQNAGGAAAASQQALRSLLSVLMPCILHKQRHTSCCGFKIS